MVWDRRRLPASDSSGFCFVGAPAKHMRMKQRFAAALALVGWYLMAAPTNSTSAPLFRWRIVETYDYASDCQEKMDALLAAPKPWSPSSRSINKAHAPRLACVATDDPRLNPNRGTPIQ
jgi:hypothetical protein